MIRSRPESDSDSFTPDLTPLLDIIFIVMVFLLLTANIQIKTMEVAIPQTTDSAVLDSPDQEVITINVLKGSPAWALQGEPVDSWDMFTTTLLEMIKANPGKPVVIAADKQANVESMLKVLAFMQNNNINATNIVMEEE
ncbi:ExbD/TolR family protein [Enterovibrio nigricans]|uniref:Biopolymer transport protein ExbD n=1 Tax=Enterovibrio nigricans DSM 22720 TaxID=1121868 RepID=A0A1T4V6F0_9GAMM|nr:biopolymer transporter ExbD [Enterovibrio nigricans]PKF50396.1 biopolymer transporter ExbD [Enterovibrio nigricans]SKA60101.1 Biopolymer transport protein ExbD [Enterovibrio nigricans DSM 22720]